MLPGMDGLDGTPNSTPRRAPDVPHKDAACVSEASGTCATTGGDRGGVVADETPDALAEVPGWVLGARAAKEAVRFSFRWAPGRVQHYGWGMNRWTKIWLSAARC